MSDCVQFSKWLTWLRRMDMLLSRDSMEWCGEPELAFLEDVERELNKHDLLRNLPETYDLMRDYFLLVTARYHREALKYFEDFEVKLKERTKELDALHEDKDDVDEPKSIK